MLILVLMPKKKEEANETEIPDSAVASEKCTSCNVNIVNDQGAVKFPCPNCGKYTVIRCSKCRKIVAKYKCPNCGFEGPN